MTVTYDKKYNENSSRNLKLENKVASVEILENGTAEWNSREKNQCLRR